MLPLPMPCSLRGQQCPLPKDTDEGINRTVHGGCSFGDVFLPSRLALLLQQIAQVEEFAQYPGHAFLSRDCIETLHDILDIQVHCCTCASMLCVGSGGFARASLVHAFT